MTIDVGKSIQVAIIWIAKYDELSMFSSVHRKPKAKVQGKPMVIPTQSSSIKQLQPARAKTRFRASVHHVFPENDKDENEDGSRQDRV